MRAVLVSFTHTALALPDKRANWCKMGAIVTEEQAGKADIYFT